MPGLVLSEESQSQDLPLRQAEVLLGEFSDKRYFKCVVRMFFDSLTWSYIHDFVSCPPGVLLYL